MGSELAGGRKELEREVADIRERREGSLAMCGGRGGGRGTVVCGLPPPPMEDGARPPELGWGGLVTPVSNICLFRDDFDRDEEEVALDRLLQGRMFSEAFPGLLFSDREDVVT